MYVDTAAKLASVREKLSGVQILGLDTEFSQFPFYQPKVQTKSSPFH